MGNEMASRVLGEVKVAERAILDATVHLPELQSLDAVIVANAFCLIAMNIAKTQGYEAARNMFQEFLGMVDALEQEDRAN